MIGAGRSSTALIDYLLKQAESHPWTIQVVDREYDLALKKIAGHPKGEAIRLSVLNPEELDLLIKNSNLVISLLPPNLHYQVALLGIRNHCPVLTASYHTKEMWGLDQEARKAGVLIMGELGLDPGIDHMSAMQMIDAIKEKGGAIRSFDSVTGGLMETDAVAGNPWRYKITWNPRNIVLAGQGTAQYLDSGAIRCVPYYSIFEHTKGWDLGPAGMFDSYPNRDSLQYIGLYGLEGIDRIYRGTLRYTGFCRDWHCLVRLGLTEDKTSLHQLGGATWASYVRRFVPDSGLGLAGDVAEFLGVTEQDERMAALKWLGLFGEGQLPVESGTPADILQVLLLDRWSIQKGDHDRILMHHQIDYELDNHRYRRTSTMDVRGDNDERTAMSKTVGLPLGILAKNILTGTVFPSGVHIPVRRDFYEPILQELAVAGIGFDETQVALEED